MFAFSEQSPVSATDPPVLDVGCGTGQETRSPATLGCEVTAVERTGSAALEVTACCVDLTADGVSIGDGRGRSQRGDVGGLEGTRIVMACGTTVTFSVSVLGRAPPSTS